MRVHYSIVLLVLFSMHLLTSARDITWFRNTNHHDDNIALIETAWTKCDHWTDNYNSIGADQDDEISFNFTALCITFKVPLNWDDPTSDITINYTITRTFSRDDIDNTADNGALWMIPGGPGGPGYDMYPFAVPYLTFLNGTYDIYIHDHRGFTSSTEFTCPGLSAYPSNCSLYTQSLWGNNSYFSVYQTALDIGYVIHLFANNANGSFYNNDDQILFGFSYGTYLINKYLQLYPAQVDAVILDGICIGDQCKFADYDENAQNTAILFFERCGLDSFCNSQFVPKYGDTIIDAIGYIFSLFDDNDDNMPCNSLNDTLTIPKARFQSFLYYLFSDEHRKNLIMPLLKRIARCNDDDMIVIETLIANVLSTWYSYEERGPGLYGDNVLQRNTYLSELWFGDDPRYGGPDYDELVEKEDTYYISARLGSYQRPIWNEWKRYLPPMDLYNKYSDPQMPVLLLNGDLDAATNVNWARNAASHWNANTNDGNYRYYVEIPNAPHGSSIQSGIVNYTDDSTDYYKYNFESCGMYIIRSFIEDPYSSPDKSCLEWLIPFDWRVSTNITKGISKKIFDTTDAWGDIEEYDHDGTLIPTVFEDIRTTDGAKSNLDQVFQLNILLLVFGSIYWM